MTWVESNFLSSRMSIQSLHNLVGDITVKLYHAVQLASGHRSDVAPIFCPAFQRNFRKICSGLTRFQHKSHQAFICRFGMGVDVEPSIPLIPITLIQWCHRCSEKICSNAPNITYHSYPNFAHCSCAGISYCFFSTYWLSMSCALPNSLMISQHIPSLASVLYPKDIIKIMF